MFLISKLKFISGKIKGAYESFSIAQRLFCYLSIIFLAIFSISTFIESLLIGSLLTLPEAEQKKFQVLAVQAKEYIDVNDLVGLKHWEEAQEYTLYVVNNKNNSVIQREMSLYVKSKMAFGFEVNQPLNNWVSRPILLFKLSPEYYLKIQLPRNLHPANYAYDYLLLMRIIVAICFLALISRLFSRYLQEPLKSLQHITRKIAEGDLSVRASYIVDGNIKEFHNLAFDFDHMAIQIEKLLASHKTLLRNISHELRTPLTRQILAMYLLKGRLNPQQLEYFHTIESNACEMNNLIQQTLEFSRLESSQHKINIRPIKLAPLVGRVVSDKSIRVSEQQSVIVTDNCPEICALVDKALVTSVLQNAVSNALKYAGKCCKVEINIYAKQDYILLEINDDGPGLSSKDLASIFEPFYRVERNDEQIIEGYGLGMAIMKESIEQMGGQIKLTSTLGEGLSVKCYLLSEKQRFLSSVNH